MNLENAWRDLLYALRSMRKNPGFAATAIVTLALGIGANTAMFSVIHSVLLKPLAYRDPDRLVRLSVDVPLRNQTDVGFSQTYVDQLRTSARSFDLVGASFIGTETMTLSERGDPEALKVARVSANFLDVLGVTPLTGRSFLPQEDQTGGPAVAMISSGLWERRFQRDPQLEGKTATFDGTPYTIVGVLPPGFAFPFSDMDVWVPRPSEFSVMPPQSWPNLGVLVSVARVKPGVSLDQVRAETEVLQREFRAAHPQPGPPAVMRVVWLKDRLVQDVRPMLWMLAGAVGFVLLIACANVASLLLSRATARSREFAVRAAIGAGQGRLIGQLLVESLLLAAIGGALGLSLAAAAVRGIGHISAFTLPRVGEIRLDLTVAAFTLALSILTSVLFGLAPALKAARPDLIGVLRASGEGSRTSDRRAALGLTPRGLLVAGEVSLSILLLIGAALLMQSFARLHSVNPGFRSEGLLTMHISLPSGYNAPRQRAFFEQLVERVEALPGVHGAAMVQSLPTTVMFAMPVSIVEQPPLPIGQAPLAQRQGASLDFFRTMGIPLRRGRTFTAQDAPGAGPVVVVINESFARRFWPEYPGGQSPVGQHISGGGPVTPEIVGVVGDVHEQGFAKDTIPELYFPLAYSPVSSADFVVRTDGDPLNLVNSVRSQVLAIDPHQAISNVRTMADVFDTSVRPQRLTTLLLEVFAGVALLLAVVGLYGAIAYSVAQRTQEVGIRRALGAQHEDILRLIGRQVLTLTLTGIAVGIGGALALTRVMKTLLFQTSATDPLTFAGIALLFILVALAASYIPARRAMRIDPMAALRQG
jgi:predicted permease